MSRTSRTLFGICTTLLNLIILLDVHTPVLAESAPAPSFDEHVWTTAQKVGVGTALGDQSKVWFTLARGVVTEVYWPQIDMAQVTDLQFLVTDGSSFFDEEMSDTDHHVEYLDDKSLAYRLINTDPDGKYVITKEIITDPERDALVLHVSFDAKVAGLKLYVLLNPAVSNTGLYDYGEIQSDALYAWDDRIKYANSTPEVGQAQALMASVGFAERSAGFVGSNDGWQDLHNDFTLDWQYDTANDGNVALIARLDIPATVGVKAFDLVLGFGNNKAAAKANAQASLDKGYPASRNAYVAGWQDYCDGLQDLSSASLDGGKLYYTSVMVLKAHEDKTYKGGMIASMTIPWGTSQKDSTSDDERGIIPGLGPDNYRDGPVGYHVVWPRDLYQVATAFLAAGDIATATSALQYLKNIQFKSNAGSWDFCSNRFPKTGSFPQNCWLSGIPHWSGLQMDQTAMPIILAWRLWQAGAIQPGDYYWDFVKPAAEFISHHGPWTHQERWEENQGISPSTTAAQIASLLLAADFAKANSDSGSADWYLQKANQWAADLEAWTFTKNGAHGDGEYFERVDGTDCGLSWNPQDDAEITIGNGGGTHRESAILDGGFLELVRFGILSPDAPAIRETIEEYDALIKLDTPQGPAFYRYNHDGYGEHTDGSDYDGSGKGQLWPLLTGERGHYELARAGGAATAVNRYIQAMEGFANEGRMLPEQVWGANLPTGARTGEGTGSATPLAWSHAEYIRLLASKQEQRVVDTPQAVLDWAQCETVFRIKYDAGWGNHIAIRGGSLPLSWNSGKAAHWTQGDVWEYRLRGLNKPFEYKTLLNDKKWEQLSGNHQGQPCAVNEITPSF